MKLVSPKLSFAAVSAALLLAGCTKKPERPAPSQTVLGPQTGGQNINSAPIPLGGGDLGGLTARDLSTFDLNGQDRTALQAQTVYFDLNQSSIKAAEREKLKAAKDYLDKNPSFRLLLEGHCDWRGTAEYNLALGDRRANAVKKYLESLGLAPDRLETLSKGSLDAIKDGGESVWAKDRRVDLVVVDPARTAPKPI